MRLGTDGPAGSGRSTDRLVSALDWTIVLLCLGLAVLLLVGGLFPARERSRRALEKNDGLADEVLRLTQENLERYQRIRDLQYDPLTIERLLREHGALDRGEVPVETDPPARTPRKPEEKRGPDR